MSDQKTDKQNETLAETDIQEKSKQRWPKVIGQRQTVRDRPEDRQAKTETQTERSSELLTGRGIEGWREREERSKEKDASEMASQSSRQAKTD